MGQFCTTNNNIFPISIYRLSFPFLSERCRPDISNGMIHDIYKLIVDIRYPSMFYVGMNRFVTPCTHYHYQSEFAVALITGDIPYKTQQVRTCILFFDFSLFVQSNVYVVVHVFCGFGLMSTPDDHTYGGCIDLASKFIFCNTQLSLKSL